MLYILENYKKFYIYLDKLYLSHKLVFVRLI